ncbi:MAG: hypothetical protein QXJ05_05735 [Nitrososphaerota archaeon]
MKNILLISLDENCLYSKLSASLRRINDTSFFRNARATLFVTSLRCLLGKRCSLRLILRRRRGLSTSSAPIRYAFLRVYGQS